MPKKSPWEEARKRAEVPEKARVERSSSCGPTTKKSAANELFTILLVVVFILVGLFGLAVLFVWGSWTNWGAEHRNHGRLLEYSSLESDEEVRLRCYMKIRHGDGSGSKHEETWEFSVDFDEMKTSLSEGMWIGSFKLDRDMYTTYPEGLYPDESVEEARLTLKEKACVADPSCDETYFLEIHREATSRRGFGISGKFEHGNWPHPYINGHCERLSGDGPLYARQFAPYGGTLLHLEATRGASKQVLEKILGSGVEIDSKDEIGATPLHWAVFYCNHSTAEALINLGAEISASADNGATPLHWAPINCEPSILALLVTKGASVSAEDAHGNTPLHAVAHRKEWYREHSLMIESLVSAGADLKKTNLKGQTPYDAAEERHDREFAVQLFGDEKTTQDRQNK